MRVTRPGETTRAAVRPRDARISRVFIGSAVAAVVLGATISIAYPSVVREGLRLTGLELRLSKWANYHGQNALRSDISRTEAFLSLPYRVVKAPFIEEFPELRIDIRFKHLRKIFEKREEALALGFLVQDDDDFVPARLQQGDNQYRVKLRLKGDLTDHLKGEKWSFRIHIRGGDSVWGMRRFSVQHPMTRGFQGEVLFFETLSHLGVLAPRYSFVDVVVNGDKVGIMGLEEHFSKELLESNKRREGIIIRFDESLFWDSSIKKKQNGIPEEHNLTMNDFRNARIDAFGSGKIRESPVLLEQLRVGVGLLRGFVEGNLPASEVFDVEKLGRYLATAELWGSWHSIRWHNQRFYLNPVSVRLEPIGFDADLQERRAIDQLVAMAEPICARMLSDEAVFEAYRSALASLTDQIADGSLTSRLREIERSYLPRLQKEYYLLQPFPMDELRERAEFLSSRTAAQLRAPAPPRVHPITVEQERGLPALVHSYVLERPDGAFLELKNAVYHPIYIDSIRWIDDTTGAPLDLDATPGVALPIMIGPRTAGPLDGSETVRLELQLPSASPNPVLEVVSSLPDQSERFVSKAVRYFPALSRNPVPTSTVDQQLASHSFLRLEGDVIRVQPGEWQVSGNLVIPPTYTLTAGPGTTLRFQPDSALVSHGTVRLTGTSEAPVRLQGTALGEDAPAWLGMIVMEAPDRSSFAHVVVSDTTGLRMDGWDLTGAISFYKSEVDITNTHFSGTRAEDALNIIQSRFAMEEVSFSDTVSDALDVDFGHGTIRGGLFERIGSAGGGDAVDISGSTVLLTGTRFVDISDKAISVGERSRMTATQVMVDQAVTGAAAKDDSVLAISDSRMRGLQLAGLMAYVKKPEFGPARIDAHGLEFDGSIEAGRAQTGSEIYIDGKPVPPEDMDVDNLYETAMRKGLRR